MIERLLLKMPTSVNPIIVPLMHQKISVSGTGFHIPREINSSPGGVRWKKNLPVMERST